MKVLMVIPPSKGRNAMIFAKRQITSLKQAGIDFQIFYLSSTTSLMQLVRDRVRIQKQIKMFNPDLIHAHYGSMTSFFCSTLSGVPIIISFRGSDLNGSKNIRGLVAVSLSQVAALRCSNIICVSKRLKEKLWWRKYRVTIIPDGVDPSMFKPLSRDSCRLALGWGKDEKVIVFNNGNGARVKRLDIASAAVNEALKKIKNIRLVILDGEIDPDSMPIYLNASDCLLVTSDSEGSPNIVKEALSCNLPVVSVEVGDVPEWLEKVNPSGLVSRSPDEIGDALVNILRMNKRSNGRNVILKDVSLDAVAEQIVNVYKIAKETYNTPKTKSRFCHNNKTYQ